MAFAARLLSASDTSLLFLCTSFAAYLYYKRFEPCQPLALFALIIIPPSLLSVPLAQFVDSTPIAVTLSLVVYNALILAFTVAYRLSPWHPLAKYPGPTLAKVSKWYGVIVSMGAKQHRHYRALHDQYGNYVRIGPNELSIRDASAVPAILGPGGLQKGPYWDHRPPSLLNRRDAKDHAHRRKPWNRAFTTAAIKEYEPFVEKRIRQLVERIDGFTRDAAQEKRMAVVDICKWLEYFTTDFMGDLAFGGSFELMKEDRDTAGVWELMADAARPIAVIANIPWSIPLIRLFTPGMKGYDRLYSFGTQSVMKRLQMGSGRKDVFYYLSGEDEQKNAAQRNSQTIASDGMLVISAGSDTTSTILTGLFNKLVLNPAAYRRLRDEVDAEFPRGEDPLDTTRLSRMPWLNACINEALRLYPPVSGGSQRAVVRGMGPKVIGEHVVPEQTQIYLSIHSIQRDPRYFSQPDQFLPERWLGPDAEKGASSSITVHNPAAFFPFSYGPTNCAGKNLAYMEMRMVVAWLVQRYIFQGPPGGDNNKWEDELEDHFILRKGPLRVEVVPRA
ncbi:cytochrome P450 [Gloeopeniophorella convolvens]|nr:cytochrome P450 [Gloeopeniophorella convolvens]